MKDSDPIVFVVDDDESVREAVKRLITSVGLRWQDLRIHARIS